MTISTPSRSQPLALLARAVFASLLTLIADTRAADATVLVFDTTLESLNLTGQPFLMPLTTDPLNSLGDSVNGFGFVNSRVDINLSPNSHSSGQATATMAGATPGAATPINRDALHGQNFSVSSFFDVFFDIAFTDVDSRPGRDFVGSPDGSRLVFTSNGPTSFQTNYAAVFDKNAPNFGLLPPPQNAPYIGGFNIEIPLGADINGNGENDKIKLTLVMLSLLDADRTFITLPDGTVIDATSMAAFVDGAVVDLSTDPPFTIGSINPQTGLPDATALVGPTTASSRLVNPIETPEPASMLLLGFGIGILAYRRRRHTQ